MSKVFEYTFKGRARAIYYDGTKEAAQEVEWALKGCRVAYDQETRAATIVRYRQLPSGELVAQGSRVAQLGAYRVIKSGYSFIPCIVLDKEQFEANVIDMPPH